MTATFIADDGQEWEVAAWPSPSCGAMYADVRRLSDGKPSVRPAGVLRAAGMLAVPNQDEQDPEGRVVHCKRAPYDVYIGRGGPWGNPYSHLPQSSAEHHVATRDEAISAYRDWLRFRVRTKEPGLIEALAELDGKILGCYCAPLPCHGDVLVKASAWAASVLASRP